MQMRYMDALHATAKLVKAGHLIYSPIVHFHGIAAIYDMPRDIDFWWELSKNMIERCDEFWVLESEGWQQSIGIMRETELAAELEKPVRTVTWPEGVVCPR
jgi:hypothetical protein